MNTERKEASSVTKQKNAEVLKNLPLENTQDFEDAKKGFILPLPSDGVVKTDKGKTVWDVASHTSFIKEGQPSPDTVNPRFVRGTLCNFLEH